MLLIRSHLQLCPLYAAGKPALCIYDSSVWANPRLGGCHVIWINLNLQKMTGKVTTASVQVHTMQSNMLHPHALKHSGLELV